MNWGDLKNFTYAELKFFTWQDVSSSSIDLYIKYRDSDLPSSITNKLLRVSQEYIRDNPELAIKINAEHKLTSSDFINVISILMSMSTIYLSNKTIIDELISDFISYISSLS